MESLKERMVEEYGFVDNMYLELYCKLVACNTETPQEKYVTNVHHIIPRYLFTSTLDCDEPSNLVNLLFRDHLLAHMYLLMCSASSTSKLANMAAIRLLTNNHSFKHEDVAQLFENADSLSSYQRAYEEASKILGKNNKSKLSGRVKIRKLDNSGKYMFKLVAPEDVASFEFLGWQRGGQPHTEEWKKSHGDKVRGHVTSDEQKRKISESNKRTHNTEAMRERKSETMRKFRSNPVVIETYKGLLAGDKNPSKRPEVRDKMSKSAKKRLDADTDARNRLGRLNSKRVECTDVNTGDTCIFCSVAEGIRALNETDYKVRSAIQTGNEYNGRVWRYIDEDKERSN